MHVVRRLLNQAKSVVGVMKDKFILTYIYIQTRAMKCQTYKCKTEQFVVFMSTAQISIKLTCTSLISHQRL